MSNVATKEDFQKVDKQLGMTMEQLLKQDPEVLKRELLNRMKMFPSKDFVPNIGQERALKCYTQKHPEYGDFPKTCIMLGGNGVGKTAIFAIFVAGVCMGPEFINKKYLNYDYFRETQKIRRKRQLKMRIVCDGADMEESGSVYEQIRQWIPCAKFSGKQSGQYYTKITIPAPFPELGERDTVIDVKTHKQDKVAHAGSNLDLILFNEPAPKHIYNENKGRIRNNGRIAMFLTPLDLAGYLCDVIDAPGRPEGELVSTECPIWDNCKDKTGTRGILSERDILDQIRDWEAVDPTEVPAREFGKFQHLAGSIFKLFSDHANVIDPMPIDPSWNVYQIIDPHNVKPDVSIWLAVTPMNRFYVIAEFPTQPWDKIMATTKTIPDFCEEFSRIEHGQHEDFGYMPKGGANIKERYGDPNMFKERSSQNGRTIKDSYSYYGNLDIVIEGIENSIKLRIDKIKQLLKYDFRRPIDDSNRPVLQVFSSCKNTIKALKYFSMKKNATGGYSYGEFEKTWECHVACVGYGVTTVESWSPNRVIKFDSRFDSDDDYAAIDRARSGRDVYEPNEVSFVGSKNYSGERPY